MRKLESTVFSLLVYEPGRCSPFKTACAPIEEIGFNADSGGQRSIRCPREYALNPMLSAGGWGLCEYSDQTVWMRRLTCFFAGRKCNLIGNVVLRLISYRCNEET